MKPIFIFIFLAGWIVAAGAPVRAANEGPLTLGQLLARVAEGNPDAAVAQARMAKARAKIGEADAAFLPRLVLGGAYSGSSNGATVFAYRGQQSSIPDGMDFNHPPESDNLNARLTAVMPLYAGGRSTAEREAARAGARAPARGWGGGPQLPGAGEGPRRPPRAASGAPLGGSTEGASGGSHLFVTGYKPCGRHSRINTISPMLENSATLGARKPV